MTREYFNHRAQISYETGSYSDGVDERKKKNTVNNLLYTWDWNLGEIVSAITGTGMQIEYLHEHKGHIDKRYSYLKQNENGRWYSPASIPEIPATFSLKAVKKNFGGNNDR